MRKAARAQREDRSVDQNFLNASWADDLQGENPARAWLLLEHLRTWRGWSATPGHPLAGRVDMDRIALVGHSRGGEAVAIAAAFNQMEHYPDDPTIRFDCGFGIRSVVAIAPTDGMYEPGGEPVWLSDVDYLGLQGDYDGGGTPPISNLQYHRVTFPSRPRRAGRSARVDRMAGGERGRIRARYLRSSVAVVLGTNAGRVR